MKLAKSQFTILFLLALVFAAPGLGAYLLYQHPTWLGNKTTNKGKFINPPILLTELQGRSKWRLILWEPKSCGLRCEEQLDKLARLRLALGRRLYEVEQWLLLSSQTSNPTQEMLALLHDQDIRFMRLAKEQEMSKYPQIYIATPDKFLILKYPVSTKPGDIFQDLKQLLNNPGMKGG